MCKRIIGRIWNTIVQKRPRASTNSWMTILSLAVGIIGLAAIITSAVLQISNNNTQIELKRYEVTFSAKQQAYASLLYNFEDLYMKSTTNDIINMGSADDRLQLSYFTMEPFLKKDTRPFVWMLYLKFSTWCYNEVRDTYPTASQEERNKIAAQYADDMETLRIRIYPDLFGEELY